jgi:DNA-binding transcriptional MocR family regulator
MARYKNLAKQFIDKIEQGVLAEGTRMPSLRNLSQSHSISLSTAVSCYQELESLGWIIAQPQAGFFVKQRINPLQTPNWLEFASKVSTPTNLSYSSNVTPGPLGISSTLLDNKTLTELDNSFRRVLKRSNHAIYRYPEPNGESILRGALAQHFSDQGFAFNPNDLVITNGCISSIKAALESCLTVGDTVAISSPCFNGLIELLAGMKFNIVEIPSLDDGINLLQLEEHLKQGTIQAGLFCTTHMNPHGVTMSTEQKMALAQLANHYRIPIIEDDVYLELSHTNHLPTPAKYYDTEGYIIWCGSVSKTLSPSFRLGWCLPGRYTSKYKTQFSVGSLGVSTQTQHAIAEFILSGQYIKYLKKKRFELLNLKHQYLDYLQSRLPKQSRFSNPSGGLVLWVQIEHLDAITLAKDAALQDIDIRIGAIFTAHDYYQNCLRINIGHPLDDKVTNQLDKLSKLIHTHCEL